MAYISRSHWQAYNSSISAPTSPTIFFDFQSENDIINTRFNAFSGGSRVIADHQLAPGEGFRAAIICYGAGTLIGFLLAWLSSNLLAALVVTGVIAGYFYTAPPLKFAYRGAGEVVNTLAFGPLIVPIAYLAQAETPSPEAIATSVFPGVLFGLLLYGGFLLDWLI